MKEVKFYKKENINAILDRAEYKDWYVLRYDVLTTKYNNEIVFKNFAEANEEFKNTHPSYIDERIELIFAPTADDKEYPENILIKYKMIN